MQVVLMSLKPYQEIGMEKHDGSQFIRVESGNGSAVISKTRYLLKDGVAVIVPPRCSHNIVAGKKGLKLYTIYSPPEHKRGTIQKTKETSS
jgi:mannose-6-phosphate isomerase-like protein (cupin superfamily)